MGDFELLGSLYKKKHPWKGALRILKYRLLVRRIIVALDC